jgi:hypothetical protein
MGGFGSGGAPARGAEIGDGAVLEPFPIRWNRLIDQKGIQIQSLEQFLFVQVASI